jgi:hypothetical protein
MFTSLNLDLLFRLGARPEAYLGRRSLLCLEAFVAGNDWAPSSTPLYSLKPSLAEQVYSRYAI